MEPCLNYVPIFHISVKIIAQFEKLFLIKLRVTCVTFTPLAAKVLRLRDRSPIYIADSIIQLHQELKPQECFG